MYKDTRDKLSSTTIKLHWIVALLMIFMISSGLYMTEVKNYDVYTVHKSVGLLAIFFIVGRVLWRIKNGWPSHASDYKAIEIILSKFVHYVLIISTVLIPLSGLFLTIFEGFSLPFFSFELIAANVEPSNPYQPIPRNEFIGSLAHTIHVFTSKILIAAIILHVVGALKHHFIDKDLTLKRMLGKGHFD